METMQKGSKWSCFVLNDNGTWTQPTYRLSHDMTEQEFSEAVLADFGHNDFLVVGIGPDEDCPDDEFVREFA